jgi:hypothetical protein
MMAFFSLVLFVLFTSPAPPDKDDDGGFDDGKFDDECDGAE